MQLAELKRRLVDLYPSLSDLPPARLDDLLARAQVRSVPAGTVLFDENSPCQAFPMIVEGAVKVLKVAPSGRELQLYRVLAGESCILTTSCILGRALYPARGIAESHTTFVALPPSLFNELVGSHEAFRNYVFGLFAERITELMQLVEAVAFHKLDQRLAALLLGKGRLVRTTHQQLADELGSVREIVSRLLKAFAEQGLVSLAREQIEIVDPAGLRRIAAPA